MKDKRIRYRSAERDALTDAGVTAFCLASANLLSAAMAEALIRHRDAIWEKAAAGGTAIWVVSHEQVRLTRL